MVPDPVSSCGDTTQASPGCLTGNIEKPVKRQSMCYTSKRNEDRLDSAVHGLRGLRRVFSLPEAQICAACPSMLTVSAASSMCNMTDDNSALGHCKVGYSAARIRTD